VLVAAANVPENLSDEELEALQKEFAALKEHADRKLHRIREHRSKRGKP
jgi:hypothetical protein